jgi:hypothetical protein
MRCQANTAAMECCSAPPPPPTHPRRCATLATVAATPGDGQEPWLVVWKKGVDGRELWKMLCPSISIGDDDPQQLLESLAATSPGLSAANQLTSSAAAQLALNCGVQFSQLLSGFAGACGGGGDDYRCRSKQCAAHQQLHCSGSCHAGLCWPAVLLQDYMQPLHTHLQPVLLNRTCLRAQETSRARTWRQSRRCSRTR